MKPLFGIDCTRDRKEGIPVCRDLVVQRLDSESENRLDDLHRQSESLLQKMDVAGPLRIVRLIGMIGFLTTFFSLVKAEVSLIEAYHNAPYIFYLMGAFLLIWLGLLVAGKRKKSDPALCAESDRLAHETEEFLQTSRKTLGVPENALHLDAIGFRFTQKKDRIRVLADTPYSYMNKELAVFDDAGNLYFADALGKYAVSKDAFISIYPVKKALLLSGWNKGLSVRDQPYDAFKMTVDAYNRVRVKNYYILEIRAGGETYGWYFPPYELYYMERLTRLTVTSKKEKR